MNQFSQINSETENPLGEYVFCCEHRFFSDYANKLAEVLAEADWSPVLTLSQMLMSLRNDGGRVFLCGNGGSAANAVHLANDLVYAVAEKTGAGIDAVALSANPAVITCVLAMMLVMKIFTLNSWLLQAGKGIFCWYFQAAVIPKMSLMRLKLLAHKT